MVDEASCLVQNRQWRWLEIDSGEGWGTDSGDGWESTVGMVGNRQYRWLGINSGDGWESTVEMVRNRQWKWLGTDSGDGNPSQTHQRGVAKVPTSVSFSILLE